MPDIKHLFHIAAPRAKVYDAIASPGGVANWWTVNASGDGTKGGALEMAFGGHGTLKMKVEEAIPGEQVVWRCSEGPNDWVGTTITFGLDENDGKTRVRFGHNGWGEAGDHMAACSFSWARYMVSLRELCEQGKGKAFGSDNY